MTKPGTKKDIVKLFIRGRQLHTAFLVSFCATLISLFYGSVGIPVPTIIPTAVPPVTVNLLLALSLLVIWSRVFSNELTLLESTSRRSWFKADLAIAFLLFACPFVLAVFGSPTLLRDCALLVACYTLIAPFTGQRIAIAVILVTILTQGVLFRISESELWYYLTITLREPTLLNLCFSLLLWFASLKNLGRLKSLTT